MTHDTKKCNKLNRHLHLHNTIIILKTFQIKIKITLFSSCHIFQRCVTERRSMIHEECDSLINEIENKKQFFLSDLEYEEKRQAGESVAADWRSATDQRHPPQSHLLRQRSPPGNRSSRFRSGSTQFLDSKYFTILFLKCWIFKSLFSKFSIYIV